MGDSGYSQIRIFDYSSSLDIELIASLDDHDEPWSMAVADLNADGIEDLVVAEGTKAVVYRNAGDGKYIVSSGYEPDYRWIRELKLVDIDGDRDLDLIASRADSELGHELSIIPNNGVGELIGDAAMRVDISSGHLGLNFSVGDIDRDGLMDILIPSNGLLRIVY